MSTQPSTNVVNEECTDDADPVRALRQTLSQLAALEPSTARYLDALAFILTRVADADDLICAEETVQIEQILRQSAGLPEEQAILVAEIAKHRKRLADCACAYRLSRELRTEVDPERRSRLLRFLYEVAHADGQVSDREVTAIEQIASELGIDPREVRDL